MTVSRLWHIATAADWEAARRAGAYTADSLATEGFIHCSTAEQWPRVQRERFSGRSDLVLLEIAAGRVGAEIRWESAGAGDELFPHIYGPLEVDAVISAQSLST